MIRTATRRPRPGFTLVELLVAAAVCCLIMAILATAFSLSIDTVRQMKSAGDMMDQLRGAATALKADLKVPHLLDANGQPVKLSSLRWDNCYVFDDTSKTAGQPGKYTVKVKTASGTDEDWKAPQNGFFRVRSTGFATTPSADADGLVNATGTATDHYLHFTSVLSGSSDDDYYRAAVPANKEPPYSSMAAEVAYFLEPVGSVPGGPSVFRLIRRQRLAALSDTDRRDRPWPAAPANPGSPDPIEAVLSLNRPAAKTLYLNTLADLTDPSKRLGGVSSGAGYTTQAKTPQDDLLAPMASRPGEDIVLSNVISFEVQVAYTFPIDTKLPIVPGRPTPFTQNSATEEPYDTLPPAPATGNNISGLSGTSTYDSWAQQFDIWTSDLDQNTGRVNPSGNVPPLLIRVQAVQIRIRVWDPRFQTGRQVTIVQDL